MATVGGITDEHRHRPKAERMHWIERVEDPGEGSIRMQLVEITHDGRGNRLVDGSMGIQITLTRGGVSITRVDPMWTATFFAETIQAWAAGDRERPTVEEWASIKGIPCG